jgi:hypothetical protein
MLIPSAVNVEITPAMLTVLWGIAHELDVRRVPENYGDAKWLEIPTSRLRNPDGRSDNVWLKTCFERLMGMKLEGEYRGSPWGAVVLAQWELTQGGSLARLLIPPAAIAAIRAPNTFARIEITAAYRLKGHARRLYAALADKKRQTQKHYHEYSLHELRTLFNTNKKYPRWADFQRYVLLPALDEINDYGTVEISLKPIKQARSIIGVRFDWKWKNLDEARVIEEENERHATARRKPSGDGSAPPLTDAESKRQQQITADRDAWKAWEKVHSGTYSQYLDWKKQNA